MQIWLTVLAFPTFGVTFDIDLKPFTANNKVSRHVNDGESKKFQKFLTTQVSASASTSTVTVPTTVTPTVTSTLAPQLTTVTTPILRSLEKYDYIYADNGTCLSEIYLFTVSKIVFQISLFSNCTYNYF